MYYSLAQLLFFPFLLSLSPSLSLPLQQKQESSDDRKFQRGLKEKQDQDMKQFQSQQKADYRATKALFKKVRLPVCLYVHVEILFKHFYYYYYYYYYYYIHVIVSYLLLF